jgi:hypothetical protein
MHYLHASEYLGACCKRATHVDRFLRACIAAQGAQRKLGHNSVHTRSARSERHPRVHVYTALLEATVRPLTTLRPRRSVLSLPPAASPSDRSVRLLRPGPFCLPLQRAEARVVFARVGSAGTPMSVTQPASKARRPR